MDLAAGVVGLAAFGVHLVEILNKYSSSVKDAKGRINAILHDTKLTTSVLRQFKDHLDEDTAVSMSDQAKQIAQEAISRCDIVFQDIHEILTGSRRPHPVNSAQLTVNLNLREQLKWHFIEPRLELLRGNLEKIKSTLQLLMSVITWGIIKKAYPDALQIIRQKEREINLLAEEKSLAVTRAHELQLRFNHSHGSNFSPGGTPDATVFGVPSTLEPHQSSSTMLIAKAQEDGMESLDRASQRSLEPLSHGLETEPNPESQPQTSDSGQQSPISQATCETTDASMASRVEEQQSHLPNSGGSACLTPDHVHTIENTPILQTFSRGLLKDYESCLAIVGRLKGFFVDANDLLFLRDGVFDVNPEWLTPIPSKSLSSIISAVEWVHTNTTDLVEAMRVRTEQQEFLKVLRRYSHDPETDLSTSAFRRKRKATSRQAFKQYSLESMGFPETSGQLDSSSVQEAESKRLRSFSSIEAGKEMETMQSLTNTTVDNSVPTAEQLLRELTDFFSNDSPSSSDQK